MWARGATRRSCGTSCGRYLLHAAELRTPRSRGRPRWPCPRRITPVRRSCTAGCGRTTSAVAPRRRSRSPSTRARAVDRRIPAAPHHGSFARLLAAGVQSGGFESPIRSGDELDAEPGRRAASASTTESVPCRRRGPVEMGVNVQPDIPAGLTFPRSTSRTWSTSTSSPTTVWV